MSKEKTMLLRDKFIDRGFINTIEMKEYIQNTNEDKEKQFTVSSLLMIRNLQKDIRHAL